MKLVHISPAGVYDSLRSRGYTQVVTASEIGTLIMVSGQLPLDQDNRLVGAADIEAQARAVYENLQRSLRAAGAELSNVLRMTTYVTDLAHAAAVRKVRAEYFGGETPPASTMIEVPRFLGGALLEVEAIAALP